LNLVVLVAPVVVMVTKYVILLFLKDWLMMWQCWSISVSVATTLFIRRMAVGCRPYGHAFRKQGSLTGARWGDCLVDDISSGCKCLL